MAIEIKHAFQSAKTNSADSTLVQPSSWNANHAITLAAGKVLGRLAGTAGAAEELPLSVDATGQSVIPPTGTTAQRPAAPLAGMVRYNSTTPGLEIYTDGTWKSISAGALTANIQSLASLVLLADRGLYATAADTLAMFTLTAFARTLLDDADAATMRATMAAQLASDNLTALDALAGTGIAVRTAANTWAQRIIEAGAGMSVTNSSGASGNPIIASLGVGIGQVYTNLGLNARTLGITYTNFSNKPISITAYSTTVATFSLVAEVSNAGIIWQPIRRMESGTYTSISIFSGTVIPPGWSYRVVLLSGTPPGIQWTQLG